MAAISNISNAPEIVLRAKERYGQALKATNVALYDPAQATADTTLMAILLLGLFVTIMFESWNDSHAWTAHIEGATALLHLRGKGQFTRELGIQLYIQFRQQILQACMHRGVPVPPALVEITMQFEASRQGAQYNSLRPGSLAVLGFRLVNLSAAMNTQQITDANAICRIAVDIDSDLNAWASKSSQSDRKFHEIAGDASKKEDNFNGREHVYNSVWGAQVWNNWRSLTIVINRIILDHVDKQSFENDELKEIMRFHSISVIQSLSTDICISTPSLSGTPRQYQHHFENPCTMDNGANNTPRSTFYDLAVAHRLTRRTEYNKCTILGSRATSGYQKVDGHKASCCSGKHDGLKMLVLKTSTFAQR
ncbi:hypothetical protein CNYM01_02557 [Colletotrichum nymphaeae SA-01]|uniref:Uncharacterized protein n=1 Tax=Colletotrichum nymphaeae SA-01 TaxID=1460502 RepID=A0A135TIR9_9PEZI|nr:hypothetical protein CNYM01_02557 [Colletotrichum nymphaeae SA-01]